jgi:predicted ATPase
MISNASIRNFKSLRDVQIKLERFTILVGPNASGKSSLLQGLDTLSRAFRGNIDAEILQATSRDAKESVELAAEMHGLWYRYRPHKAQQTPKPPGGGSRLPWDGTGKGTGPSLDTGEWEQFDSRQANQPILLPTSVLLRLEPRILASAEISSQGLLKMTPQGIAMALQATEMTPEGIGLHAALANMALNEPDTWRELQDSLRSIIPTIRRLRHTKASGQRPAELLFDTVGADSVPADQISEGTLLVLGMLTAFYSSSRPDLVLLDDLDRGLHPRAQSDLIGLLRRLLDANVQLQIVATTHSPYLLDWMQTDEVRMTVLRDDGSTVCAALASHPEFDRWKDEMTPGEMWSLFGEKWLIEQEAGR